MTVFFRDLVEPAVDRNRSIIDPGVDPAKGVNGRPCETFDLRAITDIHRHRESLPSLCMDFLDDFVQCIAAPGRQYHARPCFGSREGSSQSDAARGTGNYDHLLLQWLQLD